jgi:predicted phosphodiesterase
MRYLVLSDIHGNLEALGAALAEAARRGYDQLLVLGDLVGYGADPNGVIDRIRELKPIMVIRGNHDKAACGLEDAESFNLVAKSAVHWTYEMLTVENRGYLERLPAGPQIVDELIEICHGAPFDEDAYIFDELDALRALAQSRRPVCLFGHTHFPIAFYLSQRGLGASEATGAAEFVVEVKSGVKYLINPGSVGQPRDGDPRAAFAIADTARSHVGLYRVSYAVTEAQAKVKNAGLPVVLADRLGIGR